MPQTSGRDRETSRHALRRHLLPRREILFAHVHGSLVDGITPYHGVDVAVFLEPPWVAEHAEDLLAYALDLSTELTLALPDAIGLPVSVAVLAQRLVRAARFRNMLEHVGAPALEHRPQARPEDRERARRRFHRVCSASRPVVGGKGGPKARRRYLTLFPTSCIIVIPSVVGLVRRRTARHSRAGTHPIPNL